MTEGYDSFWCGCQNGMVGTEHCPVHGSKPMICECVSPKVDSNGACETCRKPIIRSGMFDVKG